MGHRRIHAVSGTQPEGRCHVSRDVHVKVPDELYEEIARYAQADNRKISNLFLHAVKAHMARNRKGIPNRFSGKSSQETADPALRVHATASRGNGEGGRR